MPYTSIERVKKAFLQAILTTLISIVIGFSFKIWLAQWVAKPDLALFHTVIDIISLSLILMTGFRSSMIISFAQTKNDRDIINIFRFSLVCMVLLSWGAVLPYIKHQLHIDVSYFELVGIILGLGLKVYFANLVAMYRLYHISNKVTLLDPISNLLMFLFCYYLLGLSPLSSLFIGLTLSSLIVAGYMYKHRRELITTQPLATVQFNPALVSFVKKSFTASLEAGACILMIFIAILLTIQHFSIDELGDFQVVVRPVFTYMTLLFVFPIYRFVLPELAVCVRNNDLAQIKQIKRWVYRLSILVAATFMLLMIFLFTTLCLTTISRAIHRRGPRSVALLTVLSVHDDQCLSALLYKSAWPLYPKFNHPR
ncbi:MAG: hypothetical protein OFPII_10070 [Osedax symbiont Rs1]|nr:MAG: hypothetical protein OFPII_41500 [Osedax symbiont Rs1]EPJ47595.1 MAG: hypothetical protein OFPII_10070 [Osedax symbiont Rs1]